MSVRVTRENYHIYKKVYEIISQHLFKDVYTLLGSDVNPIDLLNKWEANSQSLARKGLQSDLNDCLSNVSHWPKEIVTDINSELEKNMLPNINALSGAVRKSITKVFKSGKISSIEQYYIVKEILDNTTADISAEERRRLSVSLTNYEFTMSR